jgi:hypothetical protein
MGIWGQDARVLITAPGLGGAYRYQHYKPEDDYNHCNWISPILLITFHHNIPPSGIYLPLATPPQLQGFYALEKKGAGRLGWFGLFHPW